MPYFKNSKNELFWLDAQDDPTIWLENDCVEISENDAKQINPAIGQPPRKPNFVSQNQVQ
jgi:hypothetical protein